MILIESDVPLTHQNSKSRNLSLSVVSAEAGTIIPIIQKIHPYQLSPDMDRDYVALLFK